ncbi:MAG: tRNA epoxyqueuosine(34) reductase QueG [Hyphomicrobium aestuarii]|nr:tRNA epoxyqueuosine(34) reductase QueG [Hyphomicrobium aestuarii]
MADTDPLATPAQLKAALSDMARESGFDAFGVAAPDSLPREAGERLAAFLAQGRHGDMAWLATTSDRRADPRVLWPDVRSIIMLGLSYAPADDPLAILSRRSQAAISVYAKGRDYHDVLKAKLKDIGGRFATMSGTEVKVFVDTAPLMEKPLAAAAGLGWQGKHTNLVSRPHGSWLFLAAILTTAELPPDVPEVDHCGTCRRCLDVCPTAAFPAPYQLDARRCIAYLTIEHKGHIPRDMRSAIGNRVFGCDDCLAVCPWNKFASASSEMQFATREATDNPPIAALLALDDTAFRARYAGTPVKRTGRDRVVRNALIAAGNSADRSLLPAVERLLADASPLVRAAAVWALSRLADEATYAAARAQHAPHEADASVAAEWVAPTVRTA